MVLFSDQIFPGAEFHRLTVIRRLPKNEKGRYQVLCKCVCGKECTPNVDNLLAGNSKSCGCRKKETGAESAKAKVKPGVGYGKIFPGASFDRLTVIRRIEKNGHVTNKVLCKCKCGNKCFRTMDTLAKDLSTSCGCKLSEIITERNKATAKYKGFSTKYPKTWSSWNAMIVRCYRPNNSGYTEYGARGVVVCKWLRSHPNNLKSLIGVRKKEKPTIDRFPIHNGNYTCGKCKECLRNGWKLNVRWASRKEQSENRGDFNVYLTAFGKTMIRSQWAALYGIDEWRIHRRIHELGWDVEKAISTPVGHGQRLNFYKVR